MRRPRLLFAAGFLAVAAGAAVAVTALTRLGIVPAGSTASTPSTTLDAGALYRAAAPGTVTVSWPQSPTNLLSGSGFVADRSGRIVTNAHVVTESAGASRPGEVKPGHDFVIGFASGNTVPATLVGYDLRSDIAVLQVDPRLERLHPLTFAATDALQVGDPVAVIGSPFGPEQGQSISTGVVSGLDQAMRAPAADGYVKHVIQTDAAVNHGNSGSPLLDRRGRVVGVVSQIQTEPGKTAWSGIGLALPASAARAAVARITHAPPTADSPS